MPNVATNLLLQIMTAHIKLTLTDFIN